MDGWLQGAVEADSYNDKSSPLDRRLSVVSKTASDTLTAAKPNSTDETHNAIASPITDVSNGNAVLSAEA